MILNQCMTPAGREWEWLARVSCPRLRFCEWLGSHPKNVSFQNINFENNSVSISIPHTRRRVHASESSLFLDT
jgi:hypothetical protein